MGTNSSGAGRSTSRRTFLQSGVAAGAMAGIADLAFLSRLNPLSAAEVRLQGRRLELDGELAPIVRLIEETPRDKLLEVVASQIRDGLSYRQLLGGLLLAGVMNVEPRPSVGHKFHTVLVVNSAHLASMSSPDEHRWLPIFWALDYFKVAAQRDVEERGDWRLGQVDEGNVPSPTKALKGLVGALDDWDVERADLAITGACRVHGANAVYETLFQYGARDFRSIGHKAIYVANSYRTLGCIGWQHAEPVLRSLVYAMLAHEGSNPRDRDDEADRPYRHNLERVAQIRDDWQGGQLDPGATTRLLTVLRDGSWDDASQAVVAMLNENVSPQSVWDALHLASSELLMRQPAIVALHSVTTTNALRFAYEAAASDETRRLLMLQCAAFLPMFRESMGGRGKIAQTTLNELVEGADDVTAPESPAEVFAHLNSQPKESARKMLAYLQAGHDPQQLIDVARVLVFTKGNNAHDYKFSSAVLEDYHLVSPQWHNQYLAANIFQLRGAEGPDNQLVARTRAALDS